MRRKAFHADPPRQVAEAINVGSQTRDLCEFFFLVLVLFLIPLHVFSFFCNIFSSVLSFFLSWFLWHLHIPHLSNSSMFLPTQ